LQGRLAAFTAGQPPLPGSGRGTQRTHPPVRGRDSRRLERLLPPLSAERAFKRSLPAGGGRHRVRGAIGCGTGLGLRASVFVRSGGDQRRRCAFLSANGIEVVIPPDPKELLRRRDHHQERAGARNPGSGQRSDRLFRGRGRRGQSRGTQPLDAVLGHGVQAAATPSKEIRTSAGRATPPGRARARALAPRRSLHRSGWPDVAGISSDRRVSDGGEHFAAQLQPPGTATATAATAVRSLRLAYPTTACHMIPRPGPCATNPGVCCVRSPMCQLLEAGGKLGMCCGSAGTLQPGAPNEAAELWADQRPQTSSNTGARNLAVSGTHRLQPPIRQQPWAAQARPIEVASIPCNCWSSAAGRENL